MTSDTTRPQPLHCDGAGWGLGAANARYGPPEQPAGSAANNRPESGGFDMRVSDAERQVIADELKAHFAAGRLDIDEYEDRLQSALAARTRHDLDDLVRDLPSVSAVATAQVPPTRPFFLAILFAIGVLAVFTVVFNALHGLFFPWWLIPIAFFVFSRHWRRGWRPVYSGPSR
jgi:Domain of unknown function (DUF1707)